MPWPIMNLTVERKRVQLPQRCCSAEEVERAVECANPPFVVQPENGERFCVRRKVFLNADGLRVECENQDELHFACKLSAEDHNRWHMTDDTAAVMAETQHLEQRAAFDDGPPEESDDEPKEEEDISIAEWGQLGYKWFKRDDVLYI